MSAHGYVRAAQARRALALLAALFLMPILASAPAAASEADLVLPDLSSQSFLGTDGHTLLLGGLVVCVLGLLFGIVIYHQLKNLPVHRSMREISELIYETCKTYLVTQGKFILLLELFIGAIMVIYFGWLRDLSADKVAIILFSSLVGIAGSYGVAWFGIRVNTFANSRSAFASLRGQAVPDLRHPAQGRHVDRHAADLGRAGHHARHPALRARRLRRPLLHRLRHRRVAGRRGAAHRRRHLHQDRRHRLRPDEDRLQHQGRRRPQPRRHRRLHRRQRRRLGRPDRRRLRDLRRHRRRAHHLHPAGGDRSGGADPAPGLDLRHARHDGRHQRRLLLDQRGGRQRSLRQRRQDELRGAADLAGLAHLDRLGRRHLPRLLPAHPRASATARCGGSCRRSSPAARWPARSSPSWSRSSPRPSRSTSRRSSPRRARAAPRSTSCPASSPATSAPTGWASPSCRSWAPRTSSACRAWAR